MYHMPVNVLAILALTTILGVLQKTKAETCGTFTVENIDKHDLDGQYLRLPSRRGCQGRRAFQKYSSSLDESVYIFYVDDGLTDYGWVLGPNLCNSRDWYARAPERTRHLEDVQQRWQLSTGGVQKVEITCTKSGCQTIDIEEIDRAFFPSRAEGTYDRQHSLCTGRPVYKDYSYYLYYVITPDNWRGWVVGSTPCTSDSTFYLASDGDEYFPEDMTSPWEYNDRSDGWTYGRQHTVKCIEYYHRTKCDKLQAATISLSFFLFFTLLALLITAIKCSGRGEEKTIYRNLISTTSRPELTTTVMMTGQQAGVVQEQPPAYSTAASQPPVYDFGEPQP